MISSRWQDISHSTGPRGIQKGDWIYAADRQGNILDTRQFPPVHANFGLTNAGTYQRPIDDYDYDYDPHEYEEEEEMPEQLLTLTFTLRVAQLKDGSVGQLTMGKHILWESMPYQDTDEHSGDDLAVAAVNNRVINAMTSLFDIFPDLSIEAKALDE